jgi:hypothetical protein
MFSFKLSCVGGGGGCLTYRQVLDWMIWFIATLPYTTGNHSATTDLHMLWFTVTHALRFSVFSSHILAMNLYQSHCNLKSYMKSSLHSLIAFLPFLLNYSANCQLWRHPQFSAATANSGTRLNSNSSRPSSSLYNLRVAPTGNMFLLLLRVDSLLQSCVYCSCAAMSAAQSHRKCRLQHLFYRCVMSQRMWRIPLLCVQAIT